MTLKEIRKANKPELVVAVKFMAKNWAKLTYGELMAMSRTVQIRAEQIGVSINELNKEL